MPRWSPWPRPPSPTIWSPPPPAPASGEHVVMGRWVKTEWEHEKGSFALLEHNDGSCVSNLPISSSGDTPFPVPLVPSLATAARQFTIILSGVGDTPFRRSPLRR
uniref:Uncharacterized protein n=1 Tax=Oryza punctata TaxID=4537 RepID=A0A0E0KB67_ORYPU